MEKEILDKLNPIIGKVQNGIVLNDDEKKFLSNIDKNILDVDQILNIDNMNKNRQQSQINNIPENLIPLFNFKERTKNNSNLKESKILHLTDTHSQVEDLELLIKKAMNESEFNPDKDILVHTGDLLEDFLNMEFGTETYSGKRIVRDGILNNVEAKEFLNSYNIILDFIGINEDDLVNSKVNEKQLESFIHSLYGVKTPNFLTNKQLTEFNKHRDIVHKHLKTAIRNHARHNYTKLKNLLNKYNLNSNNLILVGGNHDVIDEMKNILGEYMIEPGKTKEINGIKFGSALNGSNGPALGPYLSDVYGYSDLKNDPKVKYNTKSFKSLLDYLHKRGFDYINESKLEELSSLSKNRAEFGIGKGSLSNYFETKIIPEVNNYISKITAKIPKFIKNDVDIYLGHGDIGKHERTSLEEKEFFNLLKNSDKIYIHGHEHENTSRKESGFNLLNSGSSRFGNYGVYTINKNNKIDDILFAKLDKNSGKIEYEYTNLDHLQPKKSYK